MSSIVSQKTEIEYILNFAQKQTVTIRLLSTSHIFTTQILVINAPDNLELTVDNRDELSYFTKAEEISLYFSSQGWDFSFESSILENDTKLVICYPEFLTKDTQRKFQRIKIGNRKNINIALFQEKESLLPEVFSTKQKFEKVESLDNDIEKAKEYLLHFFDSAAIEIFGNRSPATMPEKVLNHYRRIFSLTNLGESETGKNELPAAIAVQTQELAANTLNSFKEVLAKKGIHTILYIPIIYGCRLLGYMVLLSRGKTIDIDESFIANLNYVSFGLTNKIIKREIQEERFVELRIENISNTGILFSIGNEESETFNTGDISDFILRIYEQDINLKGVVVRKDNNEEKCTVAINFSQISEHDQSYINKVLYSDDNQED